MHSSVMLDLEDLTTCPDQLCLYLLQGGIAKVLPWAILIHWIRWCCSCIWLQCLSRGLCFRCLVHEWHKRHKWWNASSFDIYTFMCAWFINIHRTTLRYLASTSTSTPKRHGFVAPGTTNFMRTLHHTNSKRSCNIPSELGKNYFQISIYVKPVCVFMNVQWCADIV